MEARDPVGYEKQKLYEASTLASIRVKTYADMLAYPKSNPMFFVVDNDASDALNVLQDSFYFWSGIELRALTDSSKIEPAITTVASVDGLSFPRTKGFILATSETILGGSPVPILYYNNGTITNVGNLLAIPLVLRSELTA